MRGNLGRIHTGETKQGKCTSTCVAFCSIHHRVHAQSTGVYCRCMSGDTQLMPLVHVLGARGAGRRPARLFLLPCSTITVTGVRELYMLTGSEQQAWEVGLVRYFLTHFSTCSIRSSIRSCMCKKFCTDVKTAAASPVVAVALFVIFMSPSVISTSRPFSARAAD